MDSKRSKIFYDMFFRLIRCRSLENTDFDEIFSEFCTEYSVSKLEADMSMRGNVNTIPLFVNSDAQCGKRIEYSGKTGDGNDASILCFCEKGVEWSEEDNQDLYMFCGIVYTVLGKLRLAALADKFYFRDDATGLLNMNSLLMQGNRLVGQKKINDFTVIFLNLKGFNYINRRVGYKNATKIFGLYGRQFEKVFDGDEFIARLGGDNFVILCKKEKTQKIVDMLGGVNIKYDGSAGYEEFIISARAAVYEVCDEHKNFGEIMNIISALFSYVRTTARTDIVYYTPEIFMESVRMKTYGQLLEKAIENKEFEVFYQPKVDVRTNAIYGGEALVRWFQDGNMIMPALFIDVFEKEHFICKLDYYVLEIVCRDIREWIDDGIKPVKISVNFSNDHLHEESFVKNITKIVDKYKIDHSLIEVEMTETVDNEERKKLFDYINGIRSEGFTVAIDDFGTGYSSLHLLDEIPVDVLKIDRAFVNSVDKDSGIRKRILLKNIISMADDLGIEVVLEGVENSQQAGIVKKMGCFRIQGFYFDKPIVKAQFVERLKAVVYKQLSSDNSKDE